MYKALILACLLAGCSVNTRQEDTNLQLKRIADSLQALRQHDTDAVVSRKALKESIDKNTAVVGLLKNAFKDVAKEFNELKGRVPLPTPTPEPGWNWQFQLNAAPLDPSDPSSSDR